MLTVKKTRSRSVADGTGEGKVHCENGKGVGQGHLEDYRIMLEAIQNLVVMIFSSTPQRQEWKRHVRDQTHREKKFSWVIL